MEADQKYTDTEVTVQNDSHEDRDTEFSDFFFELLSEQRY